MTHPPSPIDIVAPAQAVDEAVARKCAELGLEPSAVAVEILPERDGLDAGEVRVRLTLARAEADAADPTLRVARDTLAELLSQMKVKAQVTASWGIPDAGSEAAPLLLEVHGDDLSLLIGRKGETLSALQYLTRLIAAKELGEGVNLIIDVEGYRRRREEQLRRMARRMAEQAVQRQRTLTLEPMPAHERRIIHLELRDHPGVRTESVGEGDRRKVTIVPT
jgi:spoIIIJ-associated protein